MGCLTAALEYFPMSPLLFRWVSLGSVFWGQFPVQCSSNVGLEEEEKENHGKIMGIVPEQRFLEFRASDYPGGLVNTQVTWPHPCRF